MRTDQFFVTSVCWSSSLVHSVRRFYATDTSSLNGQVLAENLDENCERQSRVYCIGNSSLWQQRATISLEGEQEKEGLKAC